MSDLMLRGVILMPYNMAMRDELSRRQFYSRAQALLADYDRMRDALEESQSLLAAMLHEQRPASEIQAQMIDNRAALAQEQGEPQ